MIRSMIHINNEGLNDVWVDPEAIEGKLHSSNENTEGLSLEQSRELLIKDFQIAREKALNKKFELEMDGAPEDELGNATYKKLVDGFELEIAKIDDNLRELGIEPMPSA